MSAFRFPTAVVDAVRSKGLEAAKQQCAKSKLEITLEISGVQARVAAFEENMRSLVEQRQKLVDQILKEFGELYGE